LALSPWQWNGVCALGASFFAAALIVWAVGSWESEGRARVTEIRPATAATIRSGDLSVKEDSH